MVRVTYKKGKRAIKQKNNKKFILIFLFVLIITGILIVNSYSKKEEFDNTTGDKNLLVESAIHDINVLGAVYAEDVVEKSDIPDEVEGYKVLGQLVIEKIDVKQNILNKTESKSLQLGVTKFYGPEINKSGNFCIAGHNWKSKLKRLNELEPGDLFYIIDKKTSEKVYYKIYDKYTCNPNNLSCLDQNKDGKKEVTLITCNPGGLTRLICKAKEI